jgi:hypothetical protein
VSIDGHISAAETALDKAQQTAGQGLPKIALIHVLGSIAHALIAIARKPGESGAAEDYPVAE